QDVHQYLVPGGGVERVRLTDEDFRTRPTVDGVWPDESEAAAGAPENPGHRPVRPNRTDGMVLAELGALVLDEAAQGIAKLGVLGGGDAQLPRQGLGLQRLVALAGQDGNDLFFKTWHGGVHNRANAGRSVHRFEG